MAIGAFDLVDGDVICNGSRLLRVAFQRRELARTERPTVMAKELAVRDLVGPYAITVVIKDIENHYCTGTICQCHCTTRNRHSDFPIMMRQLKPVSDDLNIAGWRRVAVGVGRTEEKYRG